MTRILSRYENFPTQPGLYRLRDAEQDERIVAVIERDGVLVHHNEDAHPSFAIPIEEETWGFWSDRLEDG